MLSDRCPVRPVLSCLSETFVHCGQTVGRIKMKLGMQVGLGPGHIVLGGDPAPPPLKGTAPQFSAHIRCHQMAAWIKMSLEMELGLDLGDFVLDGNPALPPQKGGRAPKFSAHCCGQTAGWMNLVLGTEVGLSPGDFVIDGEPAASPLPAKGGGAPPQFSAISIVANRLHASKCHLV